MKCFGIELEPYLKVALYIKPVNKCLYLPPTSAHKVHTDSNLVTSELRRLCVCHSVCEELLQAAADFYDRLCRRGYKRSFPTPLFTNLPHLAERLAQLQLRLQTFSLTSRGNMDTHFFPDEFQRRVKLHCQVTPTALQPIQRSDPATGREAIPSPQPPPPP